MFWEHGRRAREHGCPALRDSLCRLHALLHRSPRARLGVTAAAGVAVCGVLCAGAGFRMFLAHAGCKLKYGSGEEKPWIVVPLSASLGRLDRARFSESLVRPPKK